MVFEKLATETRNENTMNLDQMSILDILKVMNEEDKGVIKAIEKELPKIEEAVNLVIQSFNNKGRAIYVGAGTSGRLGVLDAVECVPTFGSDRKSTRLNSSHVSISYAVFCLKKKKKS